MINTTKPIATYVSYDRECPITITIFDSYRKNGVVMHLAMINNDPEIAEISDIFLQEIVQSFHLVCGKIGFLGDVS